jgi:hypothetical protein
LYEWVAPGRMTQKRWTNFSCLVISTIDHEQTEWTG